MNKVDYIKHYLTLYWNDHGFIRFFYKNFHEIDKSVYRSSQPSPIDIRKLKKIGIKTIVNLRFVTGAGYYLLEKDACKKHNINIINYPLRSRELPSRDELLEANEIIKNLDYPCLFHCKSGADRAGFMSALYFMYTKNNLQKAMEQLDFKYGHIKKSKTGVLDLFFSEYKNFVENRIEVDEPESSQEPMTSKDAYHRARSVMLKIRRMNSNYEERTIGRTNPSEFIYWVTNHYDKETIQQKHKYSNTLNIILDFIMRRE